MGCRARRALHLSGVRSMRYTACRISHLTAALTGRDASASRRRRGATKEHPVASGVRVFALAAVARCSASVSCACEKLAVTPKGLWRDLSTAIVPIPTQSWCTRGLAPAGYAMDAFDVTHTQVAAGANHGACPRRGEVAVAPVHGRDQPDGGDAAGARAPMLSPGSVLTGMGDGSGRPEHRVPRALPERDSLLLRSLSNEGVHVLPTKMEYLVPRRQHRAAGGTGLHSPRGGSRLGCTGVH